MPSKDELFSAIADERRRTADVLETLTPEQWESPSLCSEWTVRECAGHLGAGWSVPIWKFGLRMLRARGDFNAVNSAVAEELARKSPDAIIADLRANAEHRFTPPGAGPDAPLCDVMIHTQDICRPLGITHGYADERVGLLLDSPFNPRFQTVLGKGRFDNLSFVATDLDWRRGTGPEISGPALPMAVAMWGRDGAWDELAGPGVRTLRERWA